MTHEEMFDFWVDALGLKDWTIKFVDNCLPAEMPVPDVAGSTAYEESIKSATLCMLREDCHPDKENYQWEQTLIHELLHLKFCLLDDSGNDLQDRILHQQVDDMAWVLWKNRKD